jgi:hypothetical protein
MHARRSSIVIMDIRLSLSVSPPPWVLLSPSPEPSLAEAPSPPTSMPLPLEAIYSSKEELCTLIQAFAAQYSYAFRIGRSNKINNGPRSKIFYNCDRCGPPPPENHPQDYLQARKRQTTTRKTGCQFSIIAVQRTDTQWELRIGLAQNTAYTITFQVNQLASIQHTESLHKQR